MDCRTAQGKIMGFINKEMSDDEMEAFVEHVDSCQDCYEELQISYSLFLGLQMLDQEDADSFHIQHALDDLMENARSRIRKRRLVKRIIFWSTLLIIVVVVLFFTFQMIRWLYPDLWEKLTGVLF